MKTLNDTKSGQVARTTHVSMWQYFTTMSFVNAVMIPRPTVSNVPAAEKSVLAMSQNSEEGIASTNVSINGNDNDEFSEGVSDERQVKKISKDKETDKLPRINFTFGENEDETYGREVDEKVPSRRRRTLHVSDESSHHLQ